MTRNTLEFLKLMELIRNNQVIERLRGQELAELIANNKRVFKVNMTRNQIERLANDQLNDRELGKLQETIRSNLAREAENIRSNMRDEDIAQYNAYTNRYSAISNTFDDPILGWYKHNEAVNRGNLKDEFTATDGPSEYTANIEGIKAGTKAYDKKTGKIVPIRGASNATKIETSNERKPKYDYPIGPQKPAAATSLPTPAVVNTNPVSVASTTESQKSKVIDFRNSQSGPGIAGVFK